MAEPLHEAVRELGVRTRVYVPVGDARTRAWRTSCGGCSRTRRTSRSSATGSPRVGRRTRSSRRRDRALELVDRHRERRPPTDPDEPGRFVNEPPAELRRDDVQTLLVDAVARVERELDFPVPLLIDGVAIDTRKHIVSVDPGRTDGDGVPQRVGERRPREHGGRRRPSRRRPTGARRRGTNARPCLFRAADLMRGRARRARGVVRARGRQAAGRGRRRRVRGDRLLRVLRPARAPRSPKAARVLQPPGERNTLRVPAAWRRRRDRARGTSRSRSRRAWSPPRSSPGNPVVFKPAEQTPGIALRLVEILLRRRAAAGRARVPARRRRGDRSALVEHPDAAFVTFTGSKAVGLDIMQRAAVLRDPGSAT